MRLSLAPVKRLLPAGLKVHGRDGLLFQRLFWGAMAGCLATLLLAESPILESMELSMLEWRYKVADKIAAIFPKQKKSQDIFLVNFDDLSQFDLGIARFNDSASQEKLADALKVIESGQPTMVVLDLDLRGATNPELISTIKKYRNVIVALFGSLEGSTELPAADFLSHAASYGYDELIHEQNGLVCRLPINYRGIDNNSEGSFTAEGLAPVPSLTEAVIDYYRRVKGVGPPSQFFSVPSDQPLYMSYRRIDYPTISLRDTMQPDFDPAQFRDRIVIIGSTFTQRHNDVKKKSPFQESVPDIDLHADAISTLLNDDVIYSFPKNISHHLLLLIGAAFGAVASILPLGMRTAAYLFTSMSLVVLAQLAFQTFHLVLPTASPLAVLTLGFSLGTFIYLDTDLRQRNRELAQARESMQVRAEEERQRIAEDLHDETLPALSSVARMADRLAHEMEDNPVPGLMREKLDHAVIEMRRVINDLHPSVLETMGFKPAIENLVAICGREACIEFNFEDGDGRSDYNMTNFTKLQLYRIVQESLNNVQKHSGASIVELNIRENDGYLFIVVTDNGKGINFKAIRKDAHGLLNVRQRAQLVGALVEWKKPEKYPTGTELRLKIPVVETTTTGEA
ncbi:MAG: CHASE2 domain-containing protein [Cyanobacteria bacterium SZAS-4]|nr:CHASE2 domain-containing protein [Cyanobacteria bacterium SZAS-4]